MPALDYRHTHNNPDPDPTMVATIATVPLVPPATLEDLPESAVPSVGPKRHRLPYALPEDLLIRFHRAVRDDRRFAADVLDEAIVRWLAARDATRAKRNAGTVPFGTMKL